MLISFTEVHEEMKFCIIGCYIEREETNNLL